MRHLLSSVVALSTLSLSMAAHAASVNYTGIGSLTDTKGAIVSTSFTPISFTAPPDVAGPFAYSVVMSPVQDDELTLSVSFTAPGTGSGNITGDADVHTSYFFGRYTSGTISWDSTSSPDITLSNGSVVELYTTNRYGFLSDSINLSTCANNSSQACGTGYLTIGVEDNDPASAATPEPSSLVLLGTGLFSAVGVMRRKLAR